MKKLLALLIALNLALPLGALAGPTTFTSSVVPITTNLYYLGTSSPSLSEWKSIFTRALHIDGTTDGCATFTSGDLTSTGIACGTGSGGGGGSDVNWTFFNGSGIRQATSTNQVLIGASGATATSSLAKLEVRFDSAANGSILATGSTTLQAFTFTNATGTNATTTNVNAATSFYGYLNTATSSFLGALKIGLTNTNDNLLTIKPERTYSNSSSVGGAVNLDNSLNGREALVIYQGTNKIPHSGNGYVRFENASTTYSSGELYIKSAATGGGDFDLRMDSPNPDVEFVDTDYTTPGGKFEIDVGPGSTNGALRFNSRNAADNSFQSLLYMTSLLDGGRFGFFDSTPDAGVEINATSSDVQTILGVTASGGTDNQLFNIQSSGNIGIGVVAPTEKLDISGNLKVSGNATVTNATSSAFAITSILSKILRTDTNGSVVPYTGTSCTNQFVRSLDGLAAATCATVGAADVALANLTATNATLTFSGTYDGSTARTIGLNLGNANSWTALQSFTNTDSILATGSTTLQAFTFTNATGTNATTTSFFSTTASTSNLFMAKIAGAGLTSCSGASNALTYVSATLTFGCNSIASGGGANSKFATTTGNWVGLTPNGGTNINLGIGTATPVFMLESSSTTAPQLSLDNQNGPVDGKHFIQSWTGTQWRVGTTSDSTFTSTSTSLILDTQLPPTLNVGSSTPPSLVSGNAVFGSNGANGSTTIYMGKLQWDGYSSAGARYCTFVNVAGAMTTQAGACTQ